MPSSRKARQAILEMSEVTGTGPIFELGSGWGSLLIPLAKKHPERKVFGYELSIVPWLTSVAIIKFLGLKNVSVYRENYLHADLTKASVIFCYLFPEGMSAIESKLAAEDGKLEFLISNNFALPSHKPVTTIQLDDLFKSPIYLYSFSATVKANV